ncbi:MAG TPA: hypothetical protein VMR34_00720 [Candidatus Saccharimonadales bacterium]|nr:hypothetical protein [Candidatus Saccharimonadales bacterium]
MPNSSAEQWVGGQNCSGADYTTNVQSTTIPSNVTPPDAAANCSTNCNLITEYLNPIINFLSAAVGIVVVMMIVVGGIQYSSSGGNPQSAAAAKKRIANAILAAFAFLFLYGFLQFIVPGGLFNG